MNAEFTPNKNTLQHVDTFRHWCQKVLPLVYDDSLSYYELLCKVTNYLNETISNVELVGEDVGNLYTAYEQLQGFVNEYFNELDVQEEINVKLDNMAKSGDLDVILRPLFNEYDNQIKVLDSRITNLASLESGSTTGDAELLDSRVDYTGKTWDSLGKHLRGVGGQLSSEIENVENDFTQLANGYYPLKIINGQYYELGGVVHDYNVWSRTDYTPIKGDRIVLYATGMAEYCCFFTDSKTNAVANFKLDVGENIIEVPKNKNITFFGVSCETEHINNLKYKWFVAEKDNANINYTQMFNKILCVGDSVTEGYRSVGNIDKTRSYPSYLQRILNTTVDNGGISGQTPKTWYEMRISGDYHPFDFSTYDVFIINLGQNEGLTDTLDTDVNGYTNPEDFADTQTGWYCRIIEYIKSQNSNCMVFLCKGQKDATTNNVISKIGAKYNYPVIDYVAINPSLADGVASRHTSKNGVSYTCHYNTLGYFELASAINKGMNDYIIANIERFKEVMQ